MSALRWSETDDLQVLYAAYFAAARQDQVDVEELDRLAEAIALLEEKAGAL